MEAPDGRHWWQSTSFGADIPEDAPDHPTEEDKVEGGWDCGGYD